MDRTREDRIYELQQALTVMPSDAWREYLAEQCPDDVGLQNELLQRQHQLQSDIVRPSPIGFDFSEASLAPLPYSSIEQASYWLDPLGYDVIAELGRGGMGVVYRVRDRKRKQTVALKTLHEGGPASIARFKQEFRSLADVTHPNLAALHDAVSDGAHWFFTMELVEGIDLLTFVRNELGPTQALPADGVEKLRDALQQLAQGLSALHAAGKLHRDIKPSNVLISSDNRRVVVVDFGLTANLEASGIHHSRHSHVTGTFAYMSPEHAAGEALSTASDWYSVGVMLYEALTGRLPFEGQMLEVLNRKVREDGPAPSTLSPGVPHDLDLLCGGLLRRNAADRPVAGEVLSYLTQKPVTISTASARAPIPFVGREQQLDELAAAFALLRKGQPAVALIAGQSGGGKTALVEHFLDRLDTTPAPVVLAGRCYEQESVPYKVLDSAIDSLARYLERLPANEVAALLPRDVEPLTRVFPAFLNVPACKAVHTAVRPQDPQELRRRGFGALRELLARLGDRKPVVLFVDDLQWGDRDSAALLHELLRGSEPPLILFIGCFRTEDEHHSHFVRALTDQVDETLTGLNLRRIDVPALNTGEVRDLVAHISDDPKMHAQAKEIARESGGNPFFVTQLVRDSDTRDVADNVPSGVGVVALDDVVRRRVRGLPLRQQRLLETLAISTRPLDESIVCDAVGAGPEGRSDLRALRAARLVKTTRRSDGAGVETYHDRIREAVKHSLSPRTLASCHFRLARALETAGGVDPETLATHHQGAGDDATAARYYVSAGDRAAAALAFDRAANFYELALQLGDAEVTRDTTVRTRLGDSLANAGRGGPAAREYLRVADAHPSDEVDLRRRAAMQLLISGHVDEGLDAVRTVLDRVGIRLASTPTRAALSMLFRRARLRLRGLGFVERQANQIPDDQLLRVDVSWSIAVGLSMIDPVRAADFQSLNLLLALNCGEPYRVARAVGLEAAHVSSGGTTTARRTEALLRRAAALADSAGHAHADGIVCLAKGIASYLQSQWRGSVPDFREAQSTFRNECVGAIWELATAQQFELYALSFLGDLPELRIRMQEVMSEAEQRQNLYVMGGVRTLVVPFIQMANDEADWAQRELKKMLQEWSSRGFYVQHSNGRYRQAELEIYMGNPAAAVANLDELWQGMKRSHLMRVQFLRLNTTHLRLRALLSCADTAESPQASQRAAATAAIMLERVPVPFSNDAARLARAALASRTGEEERAVTLLRAAIGGFDRAETQLYAAAARRRLGFLLGGEEGGTLLREASSRFTALGVRNPERMTATLAPGFGS